MDLKNGQTKERKLSLSFLRKSLVRKSSSNQLNESSASANEENIPLPVQDCYCQTPQMEKGRKNIFKNLKKKMYLKESFLICRAKQKDQSTSNICPCARPNCDTPPSVASRLSRASTAPEVAPRERKARPADLVIPMEASIAPEDSPLDFTSLSLPEPNGGRGLIHELGSLAHEGWYWGPVSRQEAEEKLHGQPDGAFLVRDSCSNNYLLSVSFRSFGKTLHSRIEYNMGMFSLYAQEGFPTIAELINHSMKYSRAAVYCYSQPRSPTQPAFPVRLTKPLSRFMQVRSLQYLCRFVIRQYTRVDNIQKLPLPNPIKGYIEERHY